MTKVHEYEVAASLANAARKMLSGGEVLFLHPYQDVSSPPALVTGPMKAALRELLEEKEVFDELCVRAVARLDRIAESLRSEAVKEALEFLRKEGMGAEGAEVLWKSVFEKLELDNPCEGVDTSKCPTSDDLGAFMDGGLSGWRHESDYRKILLHVIDCPACYETIHDVLDPKEEADDAEQPKP